MTEEQPKTPAEDTDGASPKENEEPTAAELFNTLRGEELEDMISNAGFVPKDSIEDIVKQRLESRREEDRREAERKALEEQNEFKTLYEAEQKKVEEFAPYKESAERYRGALETHLEAQKKDLPEHVKELLEKQDPVDQLDYLSKHRDQLVAAPQGVPQTPGGSSGTGGGGSDQSPAERARQRRLIKRK